MSHIFSSCPKISWFGLPLLIISILFQISCGKYGPPLPPEAFSPRPIKQLEVSAEPAGIRFKWEAPDTDLRGEELRSMDGYWVMRKVLDNETQTTDKDVPFVRVGEVQDTHVVEREKKRAEARAAGRPARRIDADAALKKFEYIDSSVVPGQIYLYKVVPYNQGGVEGNVANLVRVSFRGNSSEIAFVDESAALEESFFE